MWVLDEVDRLMRPLLDQSHLDVAWHAGQYQALPPVYVQNSALEIAWTRVVEATGTREGRMLAPFLTAGFEGLNIDDEDDFARAEQLVADGRARSWPSRASRILASREARLPRDALLRRRLAAVALRQGDDGRRPRRLVGGDRLARLADRARGRRLATSRRSSSAAIPRAVEAIHWDLYRRTRQSPGSIVQKAIGGIENALLDLKGKALGVSVAELFGGPTRETIPLYWSHCGTTRARAWEVTGTPKLDSYEAVAALGREVVERGYRAFKTNIVVPGDEPRVLMPGFGRDGGTDRNPTPELLDALTRLLEAFREGTGGKAQPIVDLNFNLTTEGIVRVARALEPFDLAWLEVDSYDAAALAHARRRSPIPLCSGENLYTLRGFRPYLEAGAMDVASVDVIWNGFAQSLKIAALAETHEVACAPHNYYSHLATFIAAQWCAAIPNVRMLEIDVDDVPWREELTTAVPEMRDGELVVPAGPGWGCDVREDVLRSHPVA